MCNNYSSFISLKRSLSIYIYLSNSFQNMLMQDHLIFHPCVGVYMKFCLVNCHFITSFFFLRNYLFKVIINVAYEIIIRK